MTNISQQFTQEYKPVYAIVIKENADKTERGYYVESYQFNKEGRPINAHPLSVAEMIKFSTILKAASDVKSDYLTSRGLLNFNVLHVNPAGAGHVVWFSPAREVELYFKSGLTIPCGKAGIPPMIWKATNKRLRVFALNINERPTEDTPLFYAPYFNTYDDGSVCMGTVDVDIADNACLEDFISQWESYFFKSYFTHLSGTNPVTVNIVQLWQGLMNTGKPFPLEVLIQTKAKIKNLIV